MKDTNHLAGDIRNRRGTPNIIVDEIKRRRTSFVTNWKACPLVFGEFTPNTMKTFNNQTFKQRGKKTLNCHKGWMSKFVKKKPNFVFE